MWGVGSAGCMPLVKLGSLGGHGGSGRGRTGHLRVARSCCCVRTLSSRSEWTARGTHCRQCGRLLREQRRKGRYPLDSEGPSRRLGRRRPSLSWTAPVPRVQGVWPGHKELGWVPRSQAGTGVRFLPLTAEGRLACFPSCRVPASDPPGKVGRAPVPATGHNLLPRQPSGPGQEAPSSEGLPACSLLLPRASPASSLRAGPLPRVPFAPSGFQHLPEPLGQS